MAKKETSTENVQKEVSKDPVIQEIRNSLRSEAERVSSASSGVEDTISEAVSRTQEAGEASEQRIESQFGRMRGQAMDAGKDAVTGFSESRRGFASQLTALRNVVKETDNYLKDLNDRKEEALLANDAQTLNAVNGLMVEGEKMKMDALQSTFQNLLAVSSMGLQARQFELGQAESQRQFDLTYEFEGEKFQLQKDQQSFAEKQAMAGIAMQFGLSLSPTDTIDTIVEKAAATGMVSDRQALELEQMRASIRNSNAQAAKALKGDASREAFDPVMTEILATAYNNGQTEFLGGLKTNEQYASVVNKANEMLDEQITGLEEVANEYSSSKAFLDTINERLDSSNMPEVQKTRYKTAATQIAATHDFGGELNTGEVPSLKGMAEGARDVSANIWAGIGEFITGEDITGFGFGR